MKALKPRQTLLLLAIIVCPLLFFWISPNNVLRGGAKELAQHRIYAQHAASDPMHVLFLGDSITYGWGGTPAIPGQNKPIMPQHGQSLWARSFAPLGAVNFGYPGDDTSTLRWRVEHGELAGHPEVAVVLIGTNDLGLGRSPEETAEGIKAVVASLLHASPATRILLLGVFPGHASPEAPYRSRVKAVNDLLASWDKPKEVRYIDIGSVFISPDGSIPTTVMIDGIHLSKSGYGMWADAITKPLNDLLKP